MPDMILGKRGQQALQLHRIRRRMGQIFRARRTDNPNGADARRAKPHGEPDLAHESGNRSLPVGARHRHREVRLLAKKPCRHAGKKLARICRLDNQSGTAVGTLIGNDNAGAARKGLANIFCPVDFRSGQCRKNKPRLNLAAIRRQSGNQQ